MQLVQSKDGLMNLDKSNYMVITLYILVIAFLTLIQFVPRQKRKFPPRYSYTNENDKEYF